MEHIHYFCGNTEIPADLKEREPQRVALYKTTAALVRAFANIADKLEAAGYSGSDINRTKQSLDRYLKLREIIRIASQENLDLKAYEADMRHLLDTYIEAREPRKISPFDNLPLLELIVKIGIAEAINRLPDGIKSNRAAIAETVENNVRSKIIKEHLSDPAFYDKMSALLDEIIAARKSRAIEYEEYLKRIARLAKIVEAGQSDDTPEEVNTPGRRALFNNLNRNRDLALKIDEAVKKRQARWLARRAGPRASYQKCVIRSIARQGRSRTDVPHHQTAERILMNTTPSVKTIELGEIAVDVVKKDIKNLHLSVYPPTGKVRISAPIRMNLDTIRVFAISKLRWIKQQQRKLNEQERETPREYLDRESHYLWGKRYLLKLIETDAPPRVDLQHRNLLLQTRLLPSEEIKEAILDGWYRSQLKQAVPPLIAKWEPLMHVQVERFFVQQMKTKWGSCSPEAASIRLNTDLAKKPRECLEYIVVHEMAHLLEPTHNTRFIALMDQFMPKWQFCRGVLNRLPLRHERWV